MSSQQPQEEFKAWEALPGVRPELLQRIKLSPGESLNDREHLPPGVLLIHQGQMRLFGIDQRKEAFTLQRFAQGELVGAELLLRGIAGLSLTAASELEGSLLPAEDFFQLLDHHPEHANLFSTLRPWELWAAAAGRQDPRYPTAQELLAMGQRGLRAQSNALATASRWSPRAWT